MGDDLEMLKKQKELEKLEIDIGNAKATLGLERFKAWAALLGPVMTAVTVLGTVYLGFLQISAKSDSDEDANWRQTINSIDEIRPKDLAVRHFGTLLKPFLESKRYRTLAIGVTIDELPKLRDVGTFKDLFSAAFPRSDPKDLRTLLDVARRMTETGYDLQAAVAASTDEANVSLKRDERSVVLNEVALLCDPIADILRNVDHKVVSRYFSSGQNGSSKIPLDNIYFERCDFTGINFSDVDLTNSAFDYVKLDGAVLKNVTNRSEFLWGGNIWWTAREIDPDLLQDLLARFKPYVFPKDFSPGYRDGATIKQADWETNIRRLCVNAHLTCTDAQIRADFPKGL
jgi:uncharacterized protein YjbI with pentapeptide repeats